MTYDASRQPGNRTTVGFYDCSTGFAAASFGLTTPYTAGAAGACFTARYSIPKGGTITTVYYNVAGIVGAPTSIDIELRSGTRYVPDMTAGGLLASAVNNPGGTTGWHAVAGWTLVVASGAFLWVVVADKDAGVGNNVTITTGTGPSVATDPGQYADEVCQTSLDGGQTFTVTTMPQCIALVFSDGRVIGNPLVRVTGPADGRRRGAKFTLPWNARPFAFYLGGIDGTPTGLELWTGSLGPSGTPTLTSNWTLGTISMGVVSGVLFPAAAAFVQGQVYRVVATFSGPTGGLPHFDIGAGADAILRTLLPIGGNFIYTEDNGGVWLDLPDSFPECNLALAVLP